MPVKTPNQNVDEGLNYVEVRPDLGPARAGWQASIDMLRGGTPYAETVTCVIAGGELALTGPAAFVDTEALASSDELNTVNIATIAQGRMVLLAAANSTRAVVIKHLANAGAGGGEFVLPGGVDLTLTDPTLWASFRFMDGQMRYVGLMGDRPVPGRLPNLTDDVQMGGKSAIGGKPKRVAILSGNYTAIPADRGKNIVFSNPSGGSFLLPVSGAEWEVGDELFWEQQGGSLTFAKVGGGLPVHPLAHDRGLGAPSRGVVWLSSVTPFTWCLQGQTTALPAASVIERTWLRIEGTTAVVSDAGSTSWKNAITLAHTPGDNEKWVYFGNGRWQSNGGFATNAAKCRMQLAGAGPELGPMRYATHYDSLPFVIAKAYGAAPGEQSITIDLMSANAGFTAQIAQPEIQALRLETDEDLATAASVVAPTNTYVDIVSITKTLMADDYVAILSCQVASDDGGGAFMECTIDGVTKHYKAMRRNSAGTSVYTAVIPFTATAASHTLVLKGRSRVVSTTSTFTLASVTLLKKSRFEEMYYAFDDTEANDTNVVAFADRTTLTPTLQAGWYYLVLGNAAGYVDQEGSATGCRIRLTQNNVQRGPEARQLSRDPGGYHTPVSFLASKIIEKVATGAEDLAIEFASARVDDNVRIKSTAIVVLALKRSA